MSNGDEILLIDTTQMGDRRRNYTPVPIRVDRHSWVVDVGTARCDIAHTFAVDDTQTDRIVIRQRIEYDAKGIRVLTYRTRGGCE